MRSSSPSGTNLTSHLRRVAIAVTASALVALGVGVGATPAAAVPAVACGNGAGEAMCLTFALPSDLAGNYVFFPLEGASSVYVDWGDGSPVAGPITSVGASAVPHTYFVGGTTQVKIYGTSLDHFGHGTSWSGADSLGSVDSWGGLGLKSLAMALNSSSALTSVPATLPSTVTDIGGMFQSSGFAGDDNIGLWDTTYVTTMSNAFQFATRFDKSLGAWKMGSVTDATGMLNYSGMSVQSYDATLNGWNSQTRAQSLTVGAAGLYYSSAGSSAHAALQVDPFGWVLDDAGPASAATLSSVGLSGSETIRSTLQANAVTAYQPRLTYQWQTSVTGVGSWSDLAGETNFTLLVPDLQAGKYLRVCVNANNSVGTPVDLCSDATGEIAGIDPSVGTVTITGSAVTGLTLTAQTPEFIPGVPAATLTYAWAISDSSTGNGSDGIRDETGSTLLLTDSMIGRYIYVCVSDGVNQDTCTFPLTGPILGVAPNFSSVTVTGALTVRSTATATLTGLVGAPAREVFYQWYSSANGSSGWTAFGELVEVPTVSIPYSQFHRYLRVTVKVTADGFPDHVDTSSAVRVSASTPNVPRSVKGLAGDKAALVSWTAPADNGGAAVNYYKVTATPKVGTATRTCTTVTNSGALSCQVNGLAAGVGYRFTVKAHNSVGFGAASAQSAVVTPIGITWTKSGKVITAKFTPVSGATKYTEASTGATKASGVCSVAGSGSARRVTCVITLKAGKSTLTVSAFKTATVVVKAIRVQTV